MGSYDHRFVVVHGTMPQGPRPLPRHCIQAAHKEAVRLFLEVNQAHLVSAIIPSGFGDATFFIAPDGSKVGWGPHLRATQARVKLFKWLTSCSRSKHFTAFEVSLSADTGRLSFVRSTLQLEVPHA